MTTMATILIMPMVMISSRNLLLAQFHGTPFVITSSLCLELLIIIKYTNHERDYRPMSTWMVHPIGPMDKAEILKNPLAKIS